MVSEANDQLDLAFSLISRKSLGMRNVLGTLTFLLKARKTHFHASVAELSALGRRGRVFDFV